MPDPDFIRYVKDLDVHDGKVQRVWHDESLARVLIRTYDDELLVIEFRGVIDLKSRTPEQMMLYALTEMNAPSLRSVGLYLPTGTKKMIRILSWWPKI